MLPQLVYRNSIGFLLGIKNVKRKKSNFRENFDVISKSCRTLCSVENNHYNSDKFNLC